MIELKLLIPYLISQLPEKLEHKKFSSLRQYIQEFRTIGLVLPRQTGKTTFLIDHHKIVNSLLFVKSITYKSDLALQYLINVKSDDSVISYKSDFKVQKFPKFNITPYQCFLIDEYSYMKDQEIDQFYELIEEMNRDQMIADDFYVLKLTT